MSEEEAFEEVLFEIDSTHSADLAIPVDITLPLPVSVIIMPGPIKSVRLLKSKGNHLFDAFPFTRLTNSEVTALFEVYHISLRQSESQRDFNMRACPKLSFEDILQQALALTKDIDHPVFVDSNLGIFCCVK